MKSISSESYFCGIARGAEIDLIIKHPAGELLAIEIKRSLSPQISRGFHEACKDINSTQRYVVYDGKEKLPLGNNICAISLWDLMTTFLKM